MYLLALAPQLLSPSHLRSLHLPSRLHSHSPHLLSRLHLHLPQLPLSPSHSRFRSLSLSALPQRSLLHALLSSRLHYWPGY
jgi:hypothetical protein